MRIFFVSITRLFIIDWFKPTARFKVFRFEVKYTIFTWTKSFRPLGLIAENSADTRFSLYVNIFTPKQVRKHFKVFSIRFQIWILCTFGCPWSVQRDFALYLVVIMLPPACTAEFSALLYPNGNLFYSTSIT